MIYEKKVLQCPVCKDTMDAENCGFVAIHKTENGKTIVCCCPTQAKKVKKG
ncbi:MAG: hypothetical protein PVH79_02005 [Candidatus Bathyarchaeota archaeon]